jgi:membrane protein DedA with SNARE-associated domain
MEALLIKYGYVFLFLGVAAEGDAFLLAGAFMAHRGIFNLQIVIALAIVSNTLADLIYYMMARARGREWLDRRFESHKSFNRIISWMERYSDWLLLASRYAVGFRIIIPAACGALKMRPIRFNILNVAASFLWVIPTALLGFYFGDAAERLFAGARRYELWIVLILALAAALIILYRHIRHTEWFEDLRLEDLHYLAPMLIGLMGAINLLSAVWPRSQGHLRALGGWLPLSVIQPSRPLMLFAGVALLQVSHNLARRNVLAWYVAVIALSASLILHITRAFDLHHALAAGLLLAYLISNRRRYDVPGDSGSIRLVVLMTFLLAATVFIYGFVGLSHLHEQFNWHAGSNPFNETMRSGILILEPGLDPMTTRAGRFLSSLQIAGWLARLYVLALFLWPVIPRRALRMRGRGRHRNAE